MGELIPRTRTRRGWDTRSATGKATRWSSIRSDFNDRSWLDPQGHPHTEQMHVIERMRRPDLGHLEIEFTIDDPATYATPWVINRVADLDPDDDVGEYVCENNHDPEHMVGK